MVPTVMVDPPVPTQASAPVGSSSASKGRVCPQCKTAAASATEVFCPRDGAYFVEVADLEASESDPLLGKRVADFAVVARIGSGGMGTVYRALQVGMDRQVALKVLRAELADNPQVVQRFLQEAHAQARLDHPNICRVYEVGQVEGKPYIAMEFVAGTALDEARGRLSLHEKVQVIRDAALAMTARVFYINSALVVGQTVAAGEVIGTAQSLAARYPLITNHVHVELDDARGRHLDPSTILPPADPSYAFAMKQATPIAVSAVAGETQPGGTPVRSATFVSFNSPG